MQCFAEMAHVVIGSFRVTVVMTWSVLPSAEIVVTVL